MVQKAVTHKSKLFTKWKNSKTNVNYQAYTKQRNIVKTMIRSAQSKYEKNLIQQSQSYPKLLYRYLRSKQKIRHDITQLQKSDGSMTTSDTESAEELNNFFKSTFTVENADNIPNIPTKIFDSLSDINLTEDAIFHKLLALNGNKAPGPDALHPYVLKSCAASLTTPIFLLAKQSLTSGSLPDLWKRAHITPIHKQGCKFQSSNYRPISLTSQVVKLIESIIREQLWSFLTNHEALNPCQHGFVKHKSCFTNLLECLNTWTGALDSGLGVDVIYLDYSKAFDSVPHLRLISKLQAYGIRGNLLKWIENFLIGTQQKVILNGSSSKWNYVTSGVPQGSVLGPLLFILYVNDITDGLHSTLEMFADHSKLYRIIWNPCDSEALQQDLNHISNWSKLWLLNFNTTKCSVMHLGRNAKATYTLFNLATNSNTLLRPTLEQKDLGVWITPSMTFSVHCHKSASKANQALGMIKRNFKYIPKSSLMILYKTFVRPHLEYCAPIWNPRYYKDIDTMEKVQRRATKLVPSISKLNYESRLHQLQLHSLYCRWQRSDLIENTKSLIINI